MSTEAQMKGHSLSRQLEGARKYAFEKGFELVENLCDIGLSAYDGTNIQKGKLGAFIQALNSGEIIGKNYVLLVENVDRLSRMSPLDALNQFNEILSNGVEIHTIFDGVVYTKETMKKDMTQLLFSIVTMFRAHDESEQKSTRLKKRWKSNREGMRVRNLTSLCPEWLKANKSKQGFELIPERVATIRAIYDLAIEQGMGAFAIASHLNANSDRFPRFTLPRRANRGKNAGSHKTGWQKSYILRILNSRAVYGEAQAYKMVDGKRQPDGEAIHDYFPAIMSNERFVLAQARIQQRRLAGGGRKGDSFNNLFTKLIVCGECGGAVHYIDKGAPPKGGRYLRCSNASSRYHCKTKAWRYEEFEQSFFGFVSEVEFAAALEKGTDKSRKQQLLELLQVTAEQYKVKRAELKNFHKLLSGLSESAISRVREDLESINSDLAVLEERKRQAEMELEQINERSSYRVHSDVITAIATAQAASAPADLAALRRTIHNQIRLVIDRIELDGLNEPDLEHDRCFTVVFKNGHERTVFPYNTEEDEIELRELWLKADDKPKDASELIYISASTFKFVGDIDLKSVNNGTVKSKAAGKLKVLA